MPALHAAAPEVYREYYGMPMFLTIPTCDLAASWDFWIRGLGFIDLFSIPGLDRAVAHLAWHAMLTVVVGSLRQEHARAADGEATFAAVLDTTLAGLAVAAGRPASVQAAALLDAHQLAGG
jgi:hypothetical protein